MFEPVPVGENDDFSGWRSRLSSVELSSVPEFFAGVLDEAKTRLKKLENRDVPVDEDRIAVVISAFDAKDVLPGTLSEISEQIKGMRLSGDIFLVLNNGGGNTSELFDGDKPVIESVDEIVFAKTVDKKGDDLSSPRDIIINETEIDLLKGDNESNQVRLVVIRQPEADANRGKIRGLRDVYGYLRGLENYHPKYLLAIDAETRLWSVAGGRLDERAVSGLGKMLESASSGAVVGAKLRFTPYGADGSPLWADKVPPMQESISLMHGLDGYEWLPGGATLGEFNQMVAVMSTIAERMPGARIEDVLATVMFRTLGIDTTVETDVVHANRCPSVSKKHDSYQQMLRWLKGSVGLERVVGKPLAEKVIRNRLVSLFKYPIQKALSGGDVDIPHLLKGFPDYLRALRDARKQPDDFVKGEAVF